MTGQNINVCFNEAHLPESDLEVLSKLVNAYSEKTDFRVIGVLV